MSNALSRHLTSKEGGILRMKLYAVFLADSNEELFVSCVEKVRMKSYLFSSLLLGYHTWRESPSLDNGEPVALKF